MDAFIDIREAQHDLKVYARLTGRTVKEVLRDEMRLGLQAVVRATPPKNKKQGERALRGDLHRIFSVVQDPDRFESMQNAYGDRLQPADFGMSLAEMTAYHEQRRNKRGRVPQGYRAPRVPHGPAHLRGMPYVTSKQYEAYVRQRTKQLGRLKAGWKAAAVHFGAKMGAWVGRHSAHEGRFNIKMDSLGGYMEAINSVPYAARHKTLVADVWRGRSFAVARKLKRALRARTNRR